MPAKSLELRHTIRLIRELDAEIKEGEDTIQNIMEQLRSPITTIPGIGFRMGAMILAEVGDFSRFNSTDKALAYSDLSPSTYQSGQLTNGRARMEKCGTKYLRFALYNATNMSAFGSQLLLHTSPKRRQRASITMLLYLMLPRNLCALFTL